MLLSSGVVWRHRTLEDFRAECPGGDPVLQARIVDALDEALDWLESLGAPTLARETGNPRTVGRRFDPRGLTDALVRAAGDVRLHEPLSSPQILATGGFAARLARDRGLLLRANPWSEGDGLACALARGADLSAGQDEFYGRNLPAAVPEELWVAAAQLYGRHALVLDEQGREFFPGEPSWSENDLVQATARLPGGAAWYVIDARALGERVRERTVADLVETARAAGGDVRPAEELPFALPPSPKLARAAVPGCPGPRLGHSHDRRPPGRRARPRAPRGWHAGAPFVCRGRRCRRHLHGRLRERPRRRARLRPHRRRGAQRSALGTLQAAVAGSGRADLATRRVAVLDVDRPPAARRRAPSVSRRRPDELG